MQNKQKFFTAHKQAASPTAIVNAATLPAGYSNLTSSSYGGAGRLLVTADNAIADNVQVTASGLSLNGVSVSETITIVGASGTTVTSVTDFQEITAVGAVAISAGPVISVGNAGVMSTPWIAADARIQPILMPVLVVSSASASYIAEVTFDNPLVDDFVPASLLTGSIIIDSIVNTSIPAALPTNSYANGAGGPNYLSGVTAPCELTYYKIQSDLYCVRFTPADSNGVPGAGDNQTLNVLVINSH